MRTASLLAALAAPCAGGGVLAAPISFDFEQPILYNPPDLIKDHTVVIKDGVYYIYYMKGDNTGVRCAASPDLRHWTIVGDVLSRGPESFDGAAVWAPTIVPYDETPNTWFMYYTGMSSFGAQQTGLAIANVIPYPWRKAEAGYFTPLHADTSWILWDESEFSHCRDPGFFSENGTHYLTLTVLTKGIRGAVALMRSTDYLHWEDAGPLYTHDSWHVLESTYLLKRNDLYHLFFTEEGVGGVSHMASPSLMSGWDIATRSIIDGGAAAEVTNIGGDRWLISRHSSYVSVAGIVVSTIKVDTLKWYSGYPYVRTTPRLEGWTTLWGNAFVRQPVFGNNPAFRGATTDIGFEGNAWIGTYEGFSGPLSGTTPGAFMGETARGAIKSKTFVITGLSMRLLVGGGNYPDSCYVALCDAGSGLVLRKATGTGVDRMREIIWDISRWTGKSAYLLIYDNATMAMGHINVDGIEERMNPAWSSGDRNGKDGPLFDNSDLSSARPAGRRPTAAISAAPNPFNPATEISFSGTPGASCALAIYDISGRLVSRISARADGSGAGIVLWRGQGSDGSPLPSGVYLAVLEEDGRRLAVSKIVLAR